MLLSIKTSTGKNITVEAPKSVKTEVRDKQGVVFTVSYDKGTGNQIIEMEDTVQDVKIQEAQQAPLRESEEVTEDPISVESSEVIGNLNVKVAETQQELHHEGIRIYVENAGRTCTLDTSASDTMASVKAKIWEKLRILPNTQKLLLENWDLDLFSDHSTLFDNSFENGSTLRLEVSIEKEIDVFVKTYTGKTITISI
ncbi:Ubiquitin-like domain-containing protein [Caenorhabditis elegans]|uniref:Ubiquitin-like domain-containing protein n=1 Tax=Caenorhabditis elegans TaxID=6239 RepID=O44820_CAEEL|nr:Ubiquitin-like domain-containing protein [Caenorhabditis elegans]CCD67517.1 Ubiquitin-like domain-containing protein [Caenorhabditis elegans]|eukprot:NP_494127.2 Uncharacterized protein CELE_F52C6.3 [Caenorhabditis elegans]